MPATIDDVDAIVRLVNGAYRGAAAAQGWSHEAGLLEGQRTDAATLRESLACGAAILLLRQNPGAVLLGCVSVEMRADGATAYLGMLTVDPSRQAGGLGLHLLQAGEDHARRHGARRIAITVIWLRDSLIAWYERHGYVRTGAVAPFPYGDDRFGQPKRPDLHFVELDKSL